MGSGAVEHHVIRRKRARSTDYRDTNTEMGVGEGGGMEGWIEEREAGHCLACLGIQSGREGETGRRRGRREKGRDGMRKRQREGGR